MLVASLVACGGVPFEVAGSAGAAGQGTSGSAGTSGSGGRAGTGGLAGSGAVAGSSGSAGAAGSVSDGRVACTPGTGGDSLCLQFCQEHGWQTALCEASRTCQCGSSGDQQCDIAEPSDGSDGYTPCPEGMTCRIGGVCVASGPGEEGDTCANITGDCAAGLMCPNGVCRKVCRVAAPPADCTCLPIGTSQWGTCR